MGESVSQSAGQKSLRAWLEDEILDGRLIPGARIDEQDLGARFGVSRTPVREALLQLASLDLVEFRPRYGAVVRQMSVREIAAVWEVLTCLEGMAAGLAARRMTEENRLCLTEIHKQAHCHVEDGNVASYDQANRDFHELIYNGARNEYLASHALTIRRRLQAYRRLPFSRAGGLHRSFDGHQLIVDAIMEGDDQKAEVAMRDHVVAGLSFLDLVAELPTGDQDVSGRRSGDLHASPSSKEQGHAVPEKAQRRTQRP